ncbi:transposase family protein [Streptomyces sp. HC307]|uniref:transposase family protein n=1 Tax=Streptomyces flavusporus TaxID=3385496 RepID=UPI003916D1D4
MCRQSASVCLIKSPSRQHRALPGLPQRLATLADPRHRRGKRHPFVSVLLIACSAVVAGARSFAAIGQWAKNAPKEALARLSAPTASVFAVRVAPSPATVRRIRSPPSPGRRRTCGQTVSSIRGRTAWTSSAVPWRAAPSSSALPVRTTGSSCISTTPRTLRFRSVQQSGRRKLPARRRSVFSLRRTPRTRSNLPSSRASVPSGSAKV